jgi:hypothetical protein
VTWQRVHNVLYHAPKSINGSPRLVLVALADRTKGRDPAVPVVIKMSMDDVATCAGVSTRSARDAVTSLAGLGYEVRVSYGKNKHGEPIWAFRGSPPRWCVPYFPPPVGCLCPACWMARLLKGGGELPPFDPEAYEEGGGTPPPSGWKGGGMAQEGGGSTQKGGGITSEGGGAPPPLPKQINQPTDSVAQPASNPAPTDASSGKEGEIRSRARRVLDKTGHQLRASDRAAVRIAIEDALNAGHDDQVLTDVLKESISGLSRPGAGLVARITKLGDPEPSPAPPPRCGQCNTHRQIEVTDNEGRVGMARCPRCHPLRRQSAPSEAAA